MKHEVTIPAGCCPRQSIIAMDYWKGPLRTQPMVNRMCHRCKKHWFGPPEAVKQLTHTHWEAWINSPDTEPLDSAVGSARALSA